MPTLRQKLAQIFSRGKAGHPHAAAGRVAHDEDESTSTGQITNTAIRPMSPPGTPGNPGSPTEAGAQAMARVEVKTDGSGDEPAADPQKKNGILGWMPGAQRDAAIAELQKGYNEVVQLITVMRTHLVDQSRRGEKLLGLMENMPQALQSIPEAHRVQERMFGAIESHLSQQNTNARQVAGAINALASAAEHHGQVLTVIQQQLDANNQTNQRLTGGFNALNHTLAQMTKANQEAYAILGDFTAHTRQADQRLHDLISANRKHFTLLTVFSWVIAAVAIGLAIYVAATVSSGSAATPAPTPTQVVKP